MRERIAIYLTNPSRYNSGVLCCELVNLPVSADELDEALHRIGINEFNEEYFISDYEVELSSLHIPEYSSIQDLNQLAEKIEDLADYDYDKLGAVLEMESCTSITEVLDIIDELDNFDWLEDVDTDYGIGEHFADESFLMYGIPDLVTRYFDYEAYGRDIRLELNCCFTSFGLVIDNR